MKLPKRVRKLKEGDFFFEVIRRAGVRKEDLPAVLAVAEKREDDETDEERLLSARPRSCTAVLLSDDVRCEMACEKGFAAGDNIHIGYQHDDEPPPGVRFKAAAIPVALSIASRQASR